MRIIPFCCLTGIVVALSAVEASELAVPLATIKSISVYSDKDERKESRTAITANVTAGVLTAAYRMDRGPELNSAYAGVAIRLDQPIPKDARSLRFEIMKDDRAVQPATLSLRTQGGKRLQLDLQKYGSVERKWKTYAIALEDFRLSLQDRNQLSSLSFTLVRLEKGVAPTTLEGSLSIRNIAFSSQAVAARTNLPDTSFAQAKKVKKYQRGHAAWIYRESDEDVARLISHNKGKNVPIRLLFVYAGSLSFKEQSGSLTPLHTERLQWFRDRLPPEIEIHATIDAIDGKHLAGYALEEQDRLAALLADQINRLSTVQGLHLDIEPYYPDAVSFYIFLKRYLKKPLGAAVSDWDPVLMKVLDYPVLMAYDLARSPDQFRRKAAAKYKAFAQDARAARSYYFLGVPFVATMLEYEYSQHRTSGEKKPSGFKMDEFVLASLSAFKENGEIARDPYFGGIAVWGFIDKEKKGVGAARSEVGYYPHRISEQTWKLLKGFGK